MPDAFALIPADEEFTVDERLDAALAGTVPDDEPDDAPQPFGRGWIMDFQTGELVAHGTAPAVVFDLENLKAWIEKCLRTSRGAHVIYSDDYGIDAPWEMFGKPLSSELTARLADHITEALTAHDRISEVTDFTFDREPLSTLLLVSFRVVVDVDEEDEEDGSLVLDMNGVPLGRDI